MIEARRTARAVAPSALTDARLPEAIGDVTRHWSEVNDIDAVLTGQAAGRASTLPLIVCGRVSTNTVAAGATRP